MKLSKYIFLFFLLSLNLLFAQREIKDIFYSDAIVFKSEKLSDTISGRLDVYIMVPVESLEFTKSGNSFRAEYNINITVSDSLGSQLANELIKDAISFDDYKLTQGSTGAFRAYNRSFHLPAGDFTIKLTLIDNNGNKEYSQSRNISILNFKDFKFAISGLLILSSIEEKNGRYIITPYISDNVARLRDGFFIFFEIYADTLQDSIDFVYEFINTNNKIVFQSPRISKRTRDNAQHFIKVTKPPDLAAGSYIFQLIALPHSPNLPFTSRDYLGVAQRNIKFMPSLSGRLMVDINLAIRQLRYVAEQRDMDYINSAPTLEGKLERFEQFWARLDPTPNTERNEAFEEYYARINYANSNFRSYNEGWLTDKGMVYIIFGQPLNIERYPSMYGDNRVFERWTYRNNREFIFVDNTGFGDFRLIRPVTVTEKYVYGN